MPRRRRRAEPHKTVWGALIMFREPVPRPGHSLEISGPLDMCGRRAHLDLAALQVGSPKLRVVDIHHGASFPASSPRCCQQPALGRTPFNLLREVRKCLNKEQRTDDGRVKVIEPDRFIKREALQR